jgi:hypothetical protein
MSSPEGVSVNATGQLFITNTGASCIQAMSQSAGTSLFGVTLATADAVYTIAGTCGAAGNGAAGTSGPSAALNQPDSVAFDSTGDLFIVDTVNNCVRAESTTAGKVLFGITLTTANALYRVLGSCGQANAGANANGTANTSVAMHGPTSVAFDTSNDLYFADAGNACVRAIAPTASTTVLGVVLATADAAYTVAGTCGATGDSVSGTNAVAAKFAAGTWISLDSANHLFFADGGNYCVRAESGVASTVLFGTTLTTANSEYAIAGACGTNGTTTVGSARLRPRNRRYLLRPTDERDHGQSGRGRRYRRIRR